MARKQNLITKFNPIPAYDDHLRTLIDFDCIAENPQRVVVDSMYGAGRGRDPHPAAGHRLRRARNPRRDEPRLRRDPPRADCALPGGAAGAIGTGLGCFGVVTDGDADRIGAMDERGNFVDPHKIMALALKYLVEKRG